MCDNPRRPSQAAGDNPAGRTCIQIKKSRVQDPDDFDMSGPSQVHRPGPSRTGPPAQVSIPVPTLARAYVFTQRALAVPTTVSSVTSSLSFMQELSIDGDSPRGDGGEGEEANDVDDTIKVHHLQEVPGWTDRKEGDHHQRTDRNNNLRQRPTWRIGAGLGNKEHEIDRQNGREAQPGRSVGVGRAKTQ